MQIARQVNQIL